MTEKRTPSHPDTSSWWADAPALADAREPARAQGLTAAQAQERLLRFGPNRFGRQREQPLLWQFLAHFRNPLVLILLMASGVSALSGDVVNFAIISCIVLMSVTLDFVQEHRANRAAEKLRQSVMVRATVLRDGQPCECPVSGLVPGDVVLLSAGDLMPADGLVLEARDFFVNQALLTGEPYPVEKHPTPPVLATDLQDATHAVFMGTSVISGSARVLLVKTGGDTEMGGIADSVSRRPRPIPSSWACAALAC